MTTKKTTKPKKVKEELAIEETKETKEILVTKESKEVKKASEPILVFEGQTQVSSRRNVFSFQSNTKKVIVENIGGGDLYVGTTNINFTQENLVRVGETKEITDVSTFYVGALGRPFYRISHFD